MNEPILHTHVDSYIKNFVTSDQNDIAREMENYAANVGFPIVGPVAGNLMSLLAKTIHAKRVLEIGSGYGYSALWFARAVGKDGKVYCTEGNLERIKMAKEYLTRAEMWERVEYFHGFAQDFVAQAEGEFDIIYNDADKAQFPSLFETFEQHLRPGGYYIADNAIWSGRPAGVNVGDVDPLWIKGVIEHNKMVFEHANYEAAIVPTRNYDGLLIARKKEGAYESN